MTLACIRITCYTSTAVELIKLLIINYHLIVLHSVPAYPDPRIHNCCSVSFSQPGGLRGADLSPAAVLSGLRSQPCQPSIGSIGNRSTLNSYQSCHSQPNRQVRFNRAASEAPVTKHRSAGHIHAGQYSKELHKLSICLEHSPRSCK